MPLSFSKPPEPRWTYTAPERSGDVPSFLPTGLDISGMQDITCVSDAYKVYLDPITGKRHDGADYAREAQAELQ